MNMKEMKRHDVIRFFFVFFCTVFLVFGLPWSVLAEPDTSPSTVGTGQERGGKPEASQGQIFYKWTDDQGNLYLTNDLAKVPQRFRGRLERFELLPSEEEGTDNAPVRQVSKDEKRVEVFSPNNMELDGKSKTEARTLEEAPPYKEIPFERLLHINRGMDEAEILSRLGFPSLITPGDYFYADRNRYRNQIVRLIYLGKRELNEKTTVIEIQNGRVVNVERIFPF